MAGQNRNEVINHCGIVRMSPFKLICLYRSAELIAQLIMGHGASRAERLRASAQQLLLLTGDGGGGHLDHSRVLSYDFHVICETKPQKLNFWVYHLHSWWPLFLRFHPLTTNIWFLSGNNEVLVKQIACENPKKLGLTYSKNQTFDDFHIKIWF